MEGKVKTHVDVMNYKSICYSHNWSQRFAFLQPQTRWRNDTAAADLAVAAPGLAGPALAAVDSMAVASAAASIVVDLAVAFNGRNFTGRGCLWRPRLSR